MRWALVFVPLCLCTPGEVDVKNIESSADSEGYNIASEILRNSINFSVNPCEDFYEFTCGNWIASHPIPEDRNSSSHYFIVMDKVQEQLRDMYESDDTFGSNAISALKSLYKKCMDEDELNRIGARRMIENVKSFGVWPILQGDDNWKEENYNLTSLLIEVYLRHKVTAFVTFDKSKDDMKIRHLLQFNRGELLLNEKFYLDEEKNGTHIVSLKQFLTSQIEQIQKDGGLPTNILKIKKDVDEIIDLEMKVVEIMSADVNDTESSDDLHLSDMQKFMPAVNWVQFFLAVAPSASHYFASDPKILVEDIDYIKSVNILLQSTDPRIITNYIFLRFSGKCLGEMGEKYEDIKQEYDKVISGQKQKPPRWKVCTKNATQLMEYAATALYVKKELHENTKEDVLEIANNLRDEFRKNLEINDWIDGETKTEALNKLDKMLREVAYPKFVQKIESLDKYYSDLNVSDTDSFGEIVEKITRWQIKDFFEQLRRVSDRFVSFNPADINAVQYAQGSNSLRSLYDAYGNLREWWNEDAKKNYEQRAQCLIDQYGKIEVPGTGSNIDGELTLGENIADNGGVKLAYGHGGEEDRIKGLEQFDNKQMFFLGYATVYCEHPTIESLMDDLRDVHSPNRYRINQVLANQPDFAAAFDCDEGSAMNPIKRCVLW